MLPARNLFQNQKSQLVACIKKVPGLRIVRGTHDVALELIAKDLRVATLNTSRHRLSYKGKSLMAVKAAQLDHLAV